MFLLDSNAWIALFRGKSVSLLCELKQRPATDIVLCPVVLTELQYGVCRSPVEYRTAYQRLVDELPAVLEARQVLRLRQGGETASERTMATCVPRRSCPARSWRRTRQLTGETQAF